jgi:uncharacterized protein (DUF983 family)
MTSTARPGTFAAILGKLCPRCRGGRMFRAPFSMNTTCPACGLRFDRGQPGYFTGAMYVSYAMGIPLIALLTLAGYLVFPRWSLLRLVLLAWGLCIPLVPWVWQYSRVLWVYLDRAIDPDESDDRPGPGG